MTSTSLHQQVRRTIRRHGLCRPGTRLLIGISGGSDSVALTLLLLDLAQYGDFDVHGLAHLNHRLRPTAQRDEDFCRAFAGRIGLPILVEAVDVNGIARESRLSLEEAARQERYRFLEHAATAVGADRIAVGHTQDDQAETFLMKLIRGASLNGLAGVYPRRGAVIRPLLDTSRAELRSYLTARGEPWMEDETNEDLRNPRNRIRLNALPELDRVLGGDVRPNLARAAALARDDSAWLDQAADEQFSALCSETADGVQLEAAGLTTLPAPLGRRVVLRALRQVAAGREISLEHVEATLGVAAGVSGGVDVPGGRVELRPGNAVLIQQKASPK